MGMSLSNSYSSKMNGSRGRRGGRMVLLAFGAALLGALVLHKLRERYIFSLLLKEKDKELASLQLLLQKERYLMQKERDHGREMEMKNEEMRRMMYHLRTQKMELDQKAVELQSSVDSLKDEQRIIEGALGEKQNEIKLLRERESNSGNEKLSLEALTQRLKEKEAQMEELKHRLEPASKVWSVSSDDPSNPLMNPKLSETAVRGEVGLMNGENSSVADNDEGKSSKSEEGESTRTAEQRIENRLVDNHTRDVRESQKQMQGNLEDESKKDGRLNAEEATGKDEERRKTENSTENGGFRTAEEKSIAEKTETAVQKEGKDGVLRSFHDEEREDSGKAKRWRSIVQQRMLEEKERRGSADDGGMSLKSRRFFNDEEDGPNGRLEITKETDNQKERGKDLKNDNNPDKVKANMNSADAKLLKHHNFEGTEDQHSMVLNDTANHHGEMGRELLTRQYNSAPEKWQTDARKPENRNADGIKWNVDNREMNKAEEDMDEQVREVEEHEVTEDFNTTEMQEAENDAADGNEDGETGSDLEEEKEEDKEETDASEF